MFCLNIRDTYSIDFLRQDLLWPDMILEKIRTRWCVIMFFVEFSNARGKSTERLAIFGTKRGRKGAELKVPFCHRAAALFAKFFVKTFCLVLAYIDCNEDCKCRVIKYGQGVQRKRSHSVNLVYR